MRRHTEFEVVRHAPEPRRERFIKVRKLLEIAAKPCLPPLQRAPIKPALHIKNRKMSIADAGELGGLEMPQGRLVELVVNLAAGRMMKIMEFCLRRITRLHHFHLDLSRDDFDVIRRKKLQKPVHDLTPGPEIIDCCRSATLSQPGHGPLETVTVNVAHGWQKNAHGMVALTIIWRNVDHISFGVDTDLGIMQPPSGGQHLTGRNFDGHLVLHALLLCVYI